MKPDYKLTATAAIGLVILLIASSPSLERRSFVWPGSGSMIGNLQEDKNSSYTTDFKR